MGKLRRSGPALLRRRPLALIGTIVALALLAGASVTGASSLLPDYGYDEYGYDYDYDWDYGGGPWDYGDYGDYGLPPDCFIVAGRLYCAIPDGQGNPPGSTVPTPLTCAVLTGNEKRKCNTQATLAKRLAACNKLKGKKKKTCVKKAKALAKCDAKKGKKKKSCVKKAKAIGKSQKKK